MAEGEKPYRLYRGGRSKGKVPLAGRGALGEQGAQRGGGVERQGGQPGRRRPRWGRRIALSLLLLVTLTVVWLVASYLAFRSGVEDANQRPCENDAFNPRVLRGTSNILSPGRRSPV